MSDEDNTAGCGCLLVGCLPVAVFFCVLAFYAADALTRAWGWR